MKKYSLLDQALASNLGSNKLRDIALKYKVITSLDVSEGIFYDCLTEAPKDTKIEMLKEMNYDPKELELLR